MRSETDRVIDTLHRSELLATCSLQDCAAVSAAATPFTVPPSWAFLQEGRPADSAYLLLEGTVGVFRGQRRATVASASRLRGLRLDYRSLAELIRTRPAVEDAVRTVYHSRLTRAC